MSLYLIAYDCSGSTGGCAGYHSRTSAIVDEISRRAQVNSARVEVALWDDNLRMSTVKELKNINVALEGYGGTVPKLIADALWRVPDQKVVLIIISDGQVGTPEVDDCEKAMAKIPSGRIVSTEVHLIGMNVNMSVTCPFTRNCAHSVSIYNCTGETLSDQCISVTLDDLDILSKLESLTKLEDIQSKLPAIERAITARVMGTTGDRALADSVIAMRKRIVAIRAKEQGKSSVSQQFISAVRTPGQTEEALKLLSSITESYFSPELEESNLEGRVSRLVSACEGSLRQVFVTHGVRSLKLVRAQGAEKAEAEDISPSPATERAFFTCPLTMDEEQDVLILFADSAGDSAGDILSQFEVQVVDQCIQCPLSALRYPKLIDALLQRIDSAISLKAVHESINFDEPILPVSPFSRRSILGGLALGQDQEHAKASDWTIARALSSSAKVLGNPDLWFAVIWISMESKWEEMFESRLGEACREHLRRHMAWRLKNRTSFASLIGLSHVVTTRLPLDVACWFTLSSCATYRREAVVPGASDPLRTHVFHAEHLVKLCDLAGLNLPHGVTAFITRLKVVLHMLGWVKRDEKDFRDSIRALYQSHVTINRELVHRQVAEREFFVPRKYIFVDGGFPSFEDMGRAVQNLPSMYRLCTPAEIVHLAGLVDPSKAAQDVEIPFNLVAVSPPQAIVNEWGMDRPVEFSVPICPATLRPYAVLPGTRKRIALHDASPAEDQGTTWQQAAKRRYGVDPPRLLPSYKWFEEFVNKYNAYPLNRDTFLVFIYNREVICAPKETAHATLPAFVADQVDQTLQDLGAYMAYVPIEECKRRLKESRPIPQRLEMEREFLMTTQ